MTAKSQGWSTALTLLTTVIVSVLAMLVLLSQRGSGDTVSALNSGIPGTTLTQSGTQNAGNTSTQGAGAAPTATAATGTPATDSSATGSSAAGSSATGSPATGNAAASSAGNSGQPTEGSAAAGSPGSAVSSAQPAKRLEQTMVDTDFKGTGAQIYVQACQSCHMKGGKGARGAGIYPALAGNPKLASAQYVENMLMYGNGAMPSFGHYMNDQQISDIVNYVRTELNKNTDKVKPEDIKNVRPKDPHYMIFGEAAG